MQYITPESFWNAIPDTVERAKQLWRDGRASTAARVAFEDLLFGLRHQAADLGLERASDLLATLEAFAITVPLHEDAARIAERGVDAGLDMLAALRHPNVGVHRGALYRLLSQLALEIARRDNRHGHYRPVFVPPTDAGRRDHDPLAHREQ